ncbi:MAG: hypothetical protein JW973_09545 [Bacteroidales bacterium]|nr:hypothetical protein [Bacteroidales bacterium]
MNKFLKYFPVISFFAWMNYILQAQPFPCGTVVTQEQKDYEEALADSVNQIIELNRTFHLAVFIVKDNNGQSNVDPVALDEAIEQVNLAFERIRATFSLYSLTYIDNYNFDEIHLGTNEQDMTTQYVVRNMINIYFVSGLFNDENQEICGCTYFPVENRDVIFIHKDCLDGTFLTEQFGHFFNLYHTHETIFGEELAQRINCTTAGDRCCDTPADPVLTQKVSPDCEYVGNYRDPSGTYYYTTTANYMSFSPLHCRCYFSDGQYLRMINCMLLAKKHLW